MELIPTSDSATFSRPLPKTTKPSSTKSKAQKCTAISKITITIATRHPIETIWRGLMRMGDASLTEITAQEVSGDCAGLSSELPRCLNLVGRIKPSNVWEIIKKLRSCGSFKIAVMCLTPVNADARLEYGNVYYYLKRHNRFCVASLSECPLIMNMYVVTLDGQETVPDVLLPLDGPGFGHMESRPSMLLAIVVRERRTRGPEFYMTSRPLKRLQTFLKPNKPAIKPKRSKVEK